VLLAAAVGGNWLRAHEAGVAALIDVSRVHPESAPGSEVVDEPLDARFLDMLKAETVSFRSYEAVDGGMVWVFLGYFSQQKQGSQVHSPRHCYPGSGWSILEEGRAEAPWGADVARLIVGDGTEERLVMYWYQTPGSIVDGVFDLKRHLTARVLSGKAPEVVFARVSTRAGGNPTAAAERLRSFAGSVEQQVSALYAERERAR